MSELTSDQCVIAGERFFVRGLIRLPVPDADDFEWGVWVAVSEPDFLRMSALWHESGREDEPPMPGRLATELLVYERSTLDLETTIHTQPVGLRPLHELEPIVHPLVVEQRDGITLDRVQEFAEQLRH